MKCFHQFYICLSRIHLLRAKIAKREKQIHPAHSLGFNYDMQLEIDCIE
jgi:hypothetical protein